MYKKEIAKIIEEYRIMPFMQNQYSIYEEKSPNNLEEHTTIIIRMPISTGVIEDLNNLFQKKGLILSNQKGLVIKYTY